MQWQHIASNFHNTLLPQNWLVPLWCTWQKHPLEFTFPASTGQYLQSLNTEAVWSQSTSQKACGPKENHI